MIEPYSRKRVMQNKIYFELRRVFLSTRPDCEIKSPVCTHKARYVHHIKGRILHLLNVKTWMAVCKACNNYVESHTAWAKENGFLDSKMK